MNQIIIQTEIKIIFKNMIYKFISVLYFNLFIYIPYIFLLKIYINEYLNYIYYFIILTINHSQ